MNLKDSLELEKYRHECVLTQLEYERQTRLMLLQMQLDGVVPKEQEPEEEKEEKQNITYISDEQLKELKDAFSKSNDKYGGKKK